MADLNDVCRELLGNVENALGAAVVDLNSGLLLGAAHTIPYFTQSYVDAVAAAAVDMFRGDTVSVVEELLANTRGQQRTHLLREIQMTTENTYHFMAILPHNPHALVVLITSRKASLGLGWAAMRKALVMADPLCP